MQKMWGKAMAWETIIYTPEFTKICAALIGWYIFNKYGSWK